MEQVTIETPYGQIIRTFENGACVDERVSCGKGQLFPLIKSTPHEPVDWDLRRIILKDEGKTLCFEEGGKITERSISVEDYLFEMRGTYRTFVNSRGGYKIGVDFLTNQSKYRR